ncbi:MAG: SDR family NAD(P)-dependent oxidoreductase [Actinobacteria bacterium]|jgi:NAD(P)-dependent dehydrogenase (short-subunit alcohol dehydrogenase family)|nr:SDR family NAD(P)-dependent oxidoreductase [Actinomycetota bacterium]
MDGKTVLITGASTGIGRATAIYLAGRGATVYAGVRKPEDGASLEAEASGTLKSVLVDVSDAATISSCLVEVSADLGARGLDGLVNNAGITVQGPLEYLSLDDLRRQLEVNVTGQLAVTQAFLPLLRKARGRLVFTSSIAGRAPGLPLVGPYSASKAALEQLADALRVELMPTGIRVSLIEPGSIATPIWEKGDSTYDDLVAALPQEARDRYGVAMERGRKLAAATGRRGIDPIKVAKRIEHALASKHPRARYLVGNDARARAFIEAPMPERIRDKIVARVVGFGSKNGDAG